MNKKLAIVADENIPCLVELFADIAEITCLPGRRLTAADVENADALLVRSVTRVDEALLSRSNLSFVGSCTIGTDHVDLDYLASRGITFANAPGCNAAAVGDYVVAAMLAINGNLGYWRGKTVGIVGLGQVGGRLQKRLAHIGIPTRCFDPFKPEARDTFDQVLACDAITLHVPLTRQGIHKTHHLFGYAELMRMKPGALLINTSRGPVVDNAALLKCLQAQSLHVVLDVYEQEPAPELALLETVDIATAHIAGYSLHGKIRGSLQVAGELFRHFAIARQVPDLLANLIRKVQLREGEGLEALRLSGYDIRVDSRNFIRAYRAHADSVAQAAAFDNYRKNYPVRYEWSYIHVETSDAELANLARLLGFGGDSGG